MLRLLMAYLQITAGGSTLGDPEMPLREIERRMIEELGEREGWTVERRSGGRVVYDGNQNVSQPVRPTKRATATQVTALDERRSRRLLGR